MNSNEDLPRRTSQPEKVKYIVLTKKQFVELISNFIAAVEGQAKKKQSVDINVMGFEGLFHDPKVMTETLSNREWHELDYISVYMTDEQKYKRRLILSFGNYTYARTGLKIEYGSGSTDIERLAIKQSVDSFLSDYTRKVPLDDRVVPSIATFLASSGFLAWAYGAASDKAPAKMTLANHIGFVSTAVLVGVLFYGITSFIHHLVVPNFETVDEAKETVIKKILKIIVIFGTLIGIASGVLALGQWIF